VVLAVVDLPRKIDKAAEIARGANGNDFDGHGDRGYRRRCGTT
jgi:hypothetical protein